MDVFERFVKLCGEVGNFTERITGTSIVDAYFGPAELAPSSQATDRLVDELPTDLRVLIDDINSEVGDTIRREYLKGEIESLATVVEWLSGHEIPYFELVKRLFTINVKKFPEIEIDRVTQELDEVLVDIPGENLRERVTTFTKDGEIVGEELRQLIEGELQERAAKVSKMFFEKVFSTMGETITDNGVEYQAVTNEPWSGYNYYQGGFKSINQFNTDRPFNKYALLGVIFHEYEHHVSNLWREKAYVDHHYTDLSIVPLHTGRCVISEGTADTAKDFLGVTDDTPIMRAVEAQYKLRRMVSINAAIMMNQEELPEEEAIDYLVERGFRQRSFAEATLSFLRPKTPGGRPNIWAPYIFTYFIGRTEFVLPTFEKARKKDKLAEFFKTIYLNPYSCSSVTWNQAFSWL